MHSNINKAYLNGRIALLLSRELSVITLPLKLLNRGYDAPPEYVVGEIWRQETSHGDEFYMKIPDHGSYHIKWEDEWEDPVSQYEKGDVHYFQINLFENPHLVIKEYNRPRNYVMYIWKVSFREHVYI